jgi:hypothetical protein
LSSIGGYFELELGKREEFHPNAIKLNTGRNALEYILITKEYKKIYLPYFTCNVLLEPINKLNISFEYYFVNEQLEPIFDFSTIQKTACFLYTNYFGINSQNVLNIAKKCSNLIIDNAQAFYSPPIDGTDTFYSPRKFFGVSDGAYLYTDKTIEQKIDIDKSYERFEHLLRRIDDSAENGYAFFLENDKKLNNRSILQMSKLTRQLLRSIDYESIAEKRKENFEYLYNALDHFNGIKWDINKNDIPMVYPFYSENVSLRKTFIDSKIYIARYWPNVVDLMQKNTIEHNYSVNLFHLPIDQRVTKIELDTIIKIITS